MLTLHGENDPIVHLLQRLEVLISERQDDAELDDTLVFRCDEELRALQSCQGALRSVQEALKRRILLVSRKRNTFLRISTLPTELLVNIFAIAIDDDGPGSIRSNHATLSLVCQHWNRLVDTTPSLWTKIRSETMSMTMITRALEKSQNTPLDIKCTSWWQPKKQDAFLDGIIPQAHRWRKVILALAQDQTLKLKGITTLSMTFFEDLDLSLTKPPRWPGGPRGWVGEKPLDLFGGRPPPMLQKLSLVGIPVPWSPTILCHLKLLRISRIGHLGPSFDQFMAVLSACPELESLSISDVSFSGGVSTSRPNPLQMPALAMLELCALTTEITNRLLASIHAPNVVSGTLQCKVLGDPLQALFTSDISHVFDHVRSNPNTGSITCGLDQFTVVLLGPWYIKIGVENMAFAKNILVWLSPQSRIQLIANGRNLRVAREALEVAASMEGVYRIAFGYEAPASEALTLLANCSLEQGRNQWSFPALEEMLIDGDISDDEFGNLLIMLRMRNGAQDNQKNAQYPKPLRKLELWWLAQDLKADDPLIANFSSTYWPNHLDEVRRLLGSEGELMWCRRIVTEEGVLEDRVVSQGET